ncbi:MAG: hypothetical protein JOZ38_07705 [Candidatus Eremiobacteraeota bacterium]|nr:hypothetical protein [Candidatus Eremiobacteraeota bacterium]
MDSYLAAVFTSPEAARAAHADLLRLGMDVLSAVVYGRGLDGNLVKADAQTLVQADLSGAAQEALDELDAQLPNGAYALFAHVRENDPSLVNAMVAQHGGTVFRHNAPDLQSTGFHRFLEAASLYG